MSNSRNPIPGPDLPAASSPAPQRPQTLKRRISSGLNTFLAVLPIRRATPQQSSTIRSSTALGEGVVVRRVIAGANPPVVKQLPVIRVQVPSLSVPSQPCPYDSSRYHSFPSVERSRCGFCGMRPPKSPSSEPCNECRSQSAFSHLRSAFGRRPGLKVKKGATVTSSYSPQHSFSSEQGPRIVPPEVAAKRIGNPPRRAALPVPRPGAVNNSMNPPPAQRVLQSPKHRSTTLSADVPRRRKSALEHNDVRPTSPKLHYHRGLPNSKDYPHVLKGEVSQHLDAIRAGQPSPLIDFARATRLKKGSDRTTDFSETVFYGPKFSSAFSDIPEQRRSLQLPRSNLVVEGYLESGGHVVIERPRPEQQASINAQLYGSCVYPRRSPEQSHRQSRASRQSVNSHDHGRRTISRTESSTSDQRPDLQKGPGDGSLRGLRGGSGGDERARVGGCGLMLKQLLLTCHRPDRGYSTDSGSKDNLPPARTPNPDEVSRAIRRAHSISRLPKGISKGYGTQCMSRTDRSASNGASTSGLPSPRTASFAATHRQPQSMFSHLPLLGSTLIPRRRTFEGPILSSNMAVQPTTQPPINLRGGASSPSALKDHERLPSTLFWLAGGRGKSITTASWKSQKPQKRMGGLLGMALHGMDAGTEYGKKKSTSDSCTAIGILRNIAVVPETNKSVTKKKAESVKSNKTHSSGTSVSSKSSTKSRGSGFSKSSKHTASGREAQREAPLDPVPEEAAAAAAAPAAAAAAVAEPIPAGAAAAEGQPVDVLGEDVPPIEDPPREAADVGLQDETPDPNEDDNVGQAAAEGDGGANR